ncbi:MAG: ATP-binding protein [Calditrichaeota bacterium]|nr:ATP-binding protein [Calditrichota bacterium]
MNDIIRFHVPCKVKYTKMVEDFSSLIASYLNIPDIDRERLAQNLRAVMNEVFLNIVKHSNTAAIDEMVRFQFEMGMKFIVISIFDHGPGFQADSYYPPYPQYLFGKKYVLNKVLDGWVSYTIVDPFTVSFVFEEELEQDVENIDSSVLRDHGLGLSIITKLMDYVTYTYIGEGKFDWKIVKHLMP